MSRPISLHARARFGAAPSGSRAIASRPRVCVVDARDSAPAYDRLDECALDVIAVLPRLSEADLPLLGSVDVVILGCTDSMLMNPLFERRAARASRLTRLVGVASNPEPETLARAARIGFHGFIDRNVSPPAFERSVAAVLSGELAFPRSASAAFVRLLRDPESSASGRDVPALTQREQEVVDRIASGANDREIAGDLGISESTVRKHVQSALRRTGTKTRSQLAAWLAAGARARTRRHRRRPR